jgi:hypothetical protein
MNPRLALILLPFALFGCDQPTPKKAEPKTREIIGKRTQDIRDTQAEVKKGAVVSTPKVVGTDPFTVSGSAYVSAIGQTSMGQIHQAVELYRANNDGQYPKTHQEFMEGVIKANNIALPTLPYNREYSYDVATHQLNIIEYPDRKQPGR